MLGARLKREVKLTERAAAEAAKAWIEAETAARAAELPLFADYEEAATAVATRCWLHADYEKCEIRGHNLCYKSHTLYTDRISLIY
jgi:hypothetical protein